MEIVRKFGLWIVALVIIGVAAGGYFTFVRKTAAALGEEIGKLETRRSNLQSYANRPDDIPNAEWIKQAKIEAERINEQVNRCALFLAVQPLDSYQRPFYKGERLGVDRVMRNEITAIEGRWEWTQAYRAHAETLQTKIDLHPPTAFAIRADRPWGDRLPSDEEITRAQEIFWFQKDFASAVSDLNERELAELMRPPEGQAEVFPSKPSDLVLTRVPTGGQNLDDPLRGIAHDRLLAVTKAILLNDEELDLATIFDTHLRNDEDPQADFSWKRVLSMTMNEPQRQFMDWLLSDPTDYFNRRRFYDFVMELRSVRYRSDVADLLERHDFPDVALRLREMTSEDRPRILEEIGSWSRARLAQTIAAVVAINNEEDYRLVRDNHDPQIAKIESLTFTFPYAFGASGGADSAGGRGGGTTATAQDANARIWEFGMRVRIEFERIPIFIRRMLTNSWHYDIVVSKVDPILSQLAGGAASAAASEPGDTAPRRGRRRGETGLETAPAPATAPAEGPDTATVTTAAPRNHVWIDVKGRGYQYLPLRERFADRIKELTRPTPAPMPAAGASAPAAPREEP